MQMHEKKQVCLAIIRIGETENIFVFDTLQTANVWCKKMNVRLTDTTTIITDVITEKDVI